MGANEKGGDMDSHYPDLEAIWPGWKIESVLGIGLGGTVYKAVRSVNGITMESAVKVIATPEEPYNSYRLKAEGIQNPDMELYRSKASDGICEITSLLMFRNCSHVVHIEDFALVSREDDIAWNIFIRMELLRSLIDYLKDRQRLQEYEIIQLGLDLSKVLMQCEKNRIVHRDIKLENLYITEEGTYKLGDFGIVIKIDEAKTASKKGNKNYMAPEVFWERKYGTNTDIYSLGILMYMLANENKMPFFDSEYLIASEEEKERAFYRRAHAEEIPDTRHASAELNRIILKACAYDAQKRYPNAAALYRDLKEVEALQSI